MTSPQAPRPDTPQARTSTSASPPGGSSRPASWYELLAAVDRRLSSLAQQSGVPVEIFRGPYDHQWREMIAFGDWTDA